MQAENEFTASGCNEVQWVKYLIKCSAWIGVFKPLVFVWLQGNLLNAIGETTEIILIS